MPSPTMCWPPRRIKSRLWEWPAPSKISVCGRARRCLTMYSSPSICAAPAISLPPPSTSTQGGGPAAAEVLELLKLVGLEDVKDELATSLPYGKQRRLEIARAWLRIPRCCCWMSPLPGMNPQETLELTQFIGEIRKNFHMTILLIEHHMDLVMDIADRIYVLDFGKLIPGARLRRFRATNTLSTLIWGWLKMLKIENLHVSYGGIKALRGISLEVPDGKIVTPYRRQWCR